LIIELKARASRKLPLLSRTLIRLFFLGGSSQLGNLSGVPRSTVASFQLATAKRGNHSYQSESKAKRRKIPPAESAGVSFHEVDSGWKTPVTPVGADDQHFQMRYRNCVIVRFKF
jgi:hypothetical protein